MDPFPRNSDLGQAVEEEDLSRGRGVPGHGEHLRLPGDHQRVLHLLRVAAGHRPRDRPQLSLLQPHRRRYG